MLVARIFALEQSILEKCESQEISRFKGILIFFFALMSFGVVSFYYLFYLLTSDYLLALIGCIMLSFIFYTILRFTMISISVPIIEEISVKRMIYNPANIFRLVLFAAFLSAMLVPFSALLNHNMFTDSLNTYKLSIYNKYVSNKEMAKTKQLSLIQAEINKKYNDRQHLVEVINKGNSSLDNELVAFQIKKIDSSITEYKSKFAQKENNILIQNEDQLKQFSNNLNEAEMPFYRFRLVFVHKKSSLVFFLLFMIFMSIIPIYISVLVSKKSNYGKLYSQSMMVQIMSDYQKTKSDCAAYYKHKFNFEYTASDLYEDSPFNTVPKANTRKKNVGINLLSYYEKLSDGSSTTQI
jgi:hypothetical protein